MTSPAEKQALDFFHRGYSCAQSVLAPFAGALGMDESAALRLASGFGAGVGRMRGTCGAFSSLVMVAGFCRGNTSGDAGEKEQIYAFVRELAERFRKEFGTLSCRELLRLQEAPQEGARPHDRTATYYATRPCERCVTFCARLAQELLREQSPGHQS